MAIKINITASVSNLVTIRRDIEKQLQNIKMTVGMAEQTAKGTKAAGKTRTKELTEEQKASKETARNVQEIINKYKALDTTRSQFVQNAKTELQVMKQQDGTLASRARLTQAMIVAEKKLTQAKQTSEKSTETTDKTKAASTAVQELINKYKSLTISRSEFINQAKQQLAVMRQEKTVSADSAKLTQALIAAKKTEQKRSLEQYKNQAKLQQDIYKREQATLNNRKLTTQRNAYSNLISQLKAVNNAYNQGKIGAEAFSSKTSKIVADIKAQESVIKKLGGETKTLEQINKQMSGSLGSTFQKQVASVNELIQKYRQGKITTTEFKTATESINANLKQQESTIKALGGEYTTLANTRKQLTQQTKDEIKIKQQAYKEEMQMRNSQKQENRILMEQQRQQHQLRREDQKLKAGINRLIRADKSGVQAKEITSQQTFNAVAKQSLELFKARKISAQEFMAITNQLMGKTQQYGKIDNQVSSQIYRNRLLVQNAQERVNNGTARQSDLLLLQSSRFEQVSGQMKGYASNLAMIIKKFADWIIVAQLVFLPIRTMQDAVKTIIAMDDSLTDLNKVVELSKSQLNDMRGEAIQLGKEMGISAQEILKGMAEFGRIAKVKEDIIELTRVATIASNVTTMSADDAAKAITSSLITFKKDVKDAAGIVDSFNEIQNNFRVSAEDLADSISKTGFAANQAGVEIQQLEGYTAAMVSALAITGSEAGTALKSIISRTFRIGSEGESSAGKVEETLNQIGIAVRNADGEFRDFDSILKDIRYKWDELSNVTKQNVAQTIAGKYVPEGTVTYLRNALKFGGELVA